LEESQTTSNENTKSESLKFIDLETKESENSSDNILSTNQWPTWGYESESNYGSFWECYGCKVLLSYRDFTIKELFCNDCKKPTKIKSLFGKQKPKTRSKNIAKKLRENNKNVKIKQPKYKKSGRSGYKLHCIFYYF